MSWTVRAVQEAKGESQMHPPPTPNANLIGCSAKELREIKEYLHQVEIERHELSLRVAILEQARSLRLARALGDLRRSPVPAVRQIWHLLFGRGVPPPTTRPKHRRFPALDRRAMPSVTAEGTGLHRTILMEIAEQFEDVPVVVLRGCDRHLADVLKGARTITVGPHDYEFLLRGVSRPLLLVDARLIPESSPWFGVFGADDMRLNLTMAGLIEHVKQARGRVIFVRDPNGLEAPLVADFAQGAEVTSDPAGLLQQATQT